MKETIKNALTLFGYVLIAGFMCIICYLSMKMIFNFVFTDTIGYTVKGSVEGSEEKEYLYTVYYEDGETDVDEDPQWEEYEKKGYTLYKYAEKTQLSKRGNATMVIISQIMCLLMVGSFSFEILLKRGYKDGTLVRSGNKKPDKFRGLKIGVLASVPALISFVIFVIFAGANKGVAVELYMLANASFWPALDLVFASTKTAGDIAIWQFVVMFLLQMAIPAISAVSYYLGYRDFEFLSKIVYKKKKKG